MSDYDWLPEVEPPDDDRVSIISTSEIARQQAGGYLYAAGVSLPDDVVNIAEKEIDGQPPPVIDHVRQSVFMNIGRKLWSLMPFILDGSWSQSVDGQWHLVVVVDPANPQHYSINVQHPAIVDGAPGPQGAPGAPGPQGATGAPGAPGAPGVVAQSDHTGYTDSGDSSENQLLHYVILPSQIAVGRVWRLTAWGVYSMSSGTLTITDYVNAQSIAVYGPSAIVTNVPFSLESIVICDSNAPGGNFGFKAYTRANINGAISEANSGKIALNVYNPNPLSFALKAKFSFASTLNTITILSSFLEQIG